MTRHGTFAVSVLAATACLILMPAVASAQSGFAGIVRDTTGAVLPGVTVEASSPVLIEGRRSAVTNERGQYKIVDLRPGTYTVTFSLPGFSTLKRDAIELPANFTAPINAELDVGGLEQTVTVTGETPVVDTQSALNQQVLPLQLVDTVPMGGRNIQSIGAVLTGITQSLPDVGGAQGMQQTYMATHGADPRDNSVQVDGMSLNGIEGDGAIQQYYNPLMFSEMSYQTGAVSAETSGGGVRLNMIPKDGGNTFKSDLFFSITNAAFQAKSLTPALISRGLKSADAMDSMHDFNVAVGGPIKANRLWFFGSYRNWSVNQTVSNSFYNLDRTFRTFNPDFSRQVIDNNLINSGIFRLTWQATSKLKASAYLDRIFKFRGHERTQATGPWLEEAFGVRNPKIYYTAQIKLTATLTNKLLVDGGWSTNNETYTTWELQPSSLGANPIPHQDIILGNTWGAPPNSYFLHVPIRRTWVTSLSYVTGAHAFKAGMQWGYGFNRSQKRFMQQGPNPGFSVDLVQRYRNGAPDSVQVYNAPVHGQENLNADVGLYVQDSWTLNRLTITPGFRFEHFNTSIALESVGSGRFVPERTFRAVPNLPNWNDIAPRVGIAYDLFGNSKTALRGSVGKYMVAFSTVGFAQIYNPMFEDTDTRTWRDLNGDDIAQDNEIGASQNSQFGIAAVRRPDPNIKRPYTVEYSASIQRELARGVSATFGYFRRDYHRLFYSENQAIGPQDFIPLVITNPTDGTPLTVYSLSPAKLGVIDIVDKNSATNSRVYNGFEATFNARLRGATLFGGFNSGRQVSNNCQVLVGQNLNGVANQPKTAASNPNTLRYCDQSKYDIPFRTQFKVAGNYALPLGLQVSGTLQSYPGTVSYGNGSTATPWLNANYNVNAAIARGLTQTQEIIPLIPPGTKFLKRWTQLDLRLAKKFRIRESAYWQVQADLFNSSNSHTVIAQNQTYGAALDQPTQVLQGRLLSFGAQLHF